MKPMLAHHYKTKRKHVQYPCYVQPKLNGIRCLVTNNLAQSRDQILWNPDILAHILHPLRSLSSRYIFDGELYVHGWSLQKINSAIAVKRTTTHPNTHLVGYHIYDFVDRENPYDTFSIRTQKLTSLIAILPEPIQTVRTHLCLSQEDAEKLYKTFLDNRYEGMMYRDYDSPYGFESDCTNKENRWNHLLKRKDWLDDWFTIIDQETGTGKFSSVIGSLQMEMFNGRTFWAGSGLSDMERAEFVEKPAIGQRVHIKYEMLSDEGVPLKPTIIEVE